MTDQMSDQMDWRVDTPPRIYPQPTTQTSPKRTFAEYAAGEDVDAHRVHQPIVADLAADMEPGPNQPDNTHAHPPAHPRQQNQDRGAFATMFFGCLMATMFVFTVSSTFVRTFTRQTTRAGRAAYENRAHLNQTFTAAVQAVNRAKRRMVSITIRRPANPSPRRRLPSPPPSPLRGNHLHPRPHFVNNRRLSWEEEMRNAAVEAQLHAMHGVQPTTILQLVDTEMDGLQYTTADYLVTTHGDDEVVDIDISDLSPSPASDEISDESSMIWSPLPPKAYTDTDGIFDMESLSSPLSEVPSNISSLITTPIAKTPKKRVEFFESPTTGGPVSRIKRFVKDESMAYPISSSPSSSSLSSSVSSSALSFNSSNLRLEANGHNGALPYTEANRNLRCPTFTPATREQIGTSQGHPEPAGNIIGGPYYDETQLAIAFAIIDASRNAQNANSDIAPSSSIESNSHPESTGNAIQANNRSIGNIPILAPGPIIPFPIFPPPAKTSDSHGAVPTKIYHRQQLGRQTRPRRVSSLTITANGSPIRARSLSPVSPTKDYLEASTDRLSPQEITNSLSGVENSVPFTIDYSSSENNQSTTPPGSPEGQHPTAATGPSERQLSTTPSDSPSYLLTAEQDSLSEDELTSPPKVEQETSSEDESSSPSRVEQHSPVNNDSSSLLKEEVSSSIGEESSSLPQDESNEEPRPPTKEGPNYPMKGESSSSSEEEFSTSSDEVVSKTSSGRATDKSDRSGKQRRSSRKATPEKVVKRLGALELSGRRSSSRQQQKREEKEKKRKALLATRAAEEKARKEKEEAEAQARKLREEEEERKRKGIRHRSTVKLIKPLSAEWEAKVAEAMTYPDMRVMATTSTGTKLLRRDFGTLLPQQGRDRASGWLNDEIIAAYLQAIVDHGLAASNHKRGQTPKLHAFNTFFYKNLRDKGPESIRRWASKAKIGGKDLDSVQHVFIPVHQGAHWTLLVVSPSNRTIEYFDSLGGDPRSHIRNAKAWLKQELGVGWKEDEWRVLDNDSPMQDNSRDCGVFTVTTAKMIALGWDPAANYGARDIEVQRMRMVAELMHGSFEGEFEPIDAEG
ncbi:Smt3-specific protease [Toensbergia leucococca]|nr:Smt3-specific protease [Toensbergia leucococca]